MRWDEYNGGGIARSRRFLFHLIGDPGPDSVDSLLDLRPWYAFLENELCVT
jgi:hypothetical protein